MVTKKSTPLTLEVFEKAILPRIGEMMDERIYRKMSEFDDKIDGVEESVAGLRNDVLGFKDEIIGRLDKIETNIDILSHQQSGTLARIVRVEKHLNLPSAD